MVGGEGEVDGDGDTWSLVASGSTVSSVVWTSECVRDDGIGFGDTGPIGLSTPMMSWITRPSDCRLSL
jgi:hypothetical protein